jgi:xeroderma pigmentosum group C-complementing protein
VIPLPDGYAREVTVRYAQAFNAKTSKMRAPIGKNGEDWWDRVMKIMERPYRLVSAPKNDGGDDLAV